MNKARRNISFEQLTNIVRKDERDFILGILTDRKNQLVEQQDFEEAANLRDVIEFIKVNTHIPLNSMNNGEGVPIKVEDES